MEDLQVILQESLVWTQTAKRERITEVFVPIFQPYGASQDDFENAKFTEDTGYCLFGNCSESYSAWAEINPGRTVFFFLVILRVGGTLTCILVSVYTVLEDRSFEDLHLRMMK